MKLLLVLIVIVLIQNVAARHPRHQNHKNKNHKKARRQLTSAELFQEHAASAPESLAEVAVDTLTCPLGCACQYAHFMDLPISRWINHMQRQRQRSLPSASEDHDMTNDNEVVFDGDDSFLINPYIKQATCILQEENDANELVQRLPHDLQALILLYTGMGKNKTVNASIFAPLNQLVTLEIRGSQDRSFRLIFDKPLSFLQHANFESITLLGSEATKRPVNPVHPSESFDYKPRSLELFLGYETSDDQSTANEDGNKTQLDFEVEPLIMILPYEMYMLEKKKASMPTFFGWEHLEVLRIHACQLDELDWEMFDGLQALQHLSLEHNGIVVVPPFALFGALHIKTLSLAHNHIADLHFRSLAGLLELEVLDLSDNHLRKLSEHSFPPFPKLERVDFRNNPILNIYPATFWVMNTTHEMRFDSREAPLALWGNIPFESLGDLKELSIGNVSIGSLESNIFKGLRSLERLTLKGEIHSIEFDAFADLADLRELEMSHCRISEISMDALMGCKKLEILNLAHNNISYLPPGLFDDQRALIEIYLQGNQLRTLPTMFFMQPKLRLARLDDNPWRCSCDMAHWRSRVTNQERGPRIDRCITDYQTGKQLACRRVDSSTFDHRLAPRCANFNERSVYYVLRKHLQCGSVRVVQSRTKHQRTIATPLDGDGGNGEAGGRSHTFSEQPQREGPVDNRLAWQIRREQKVRRTLALRNTLDFMLQQERHAAQRRKLATVTARVDDELSNEI